MPDVISGLHCPNCAGTLSVREGQRIVRCPYCGARSLVRGERGLERYQVARRIDRDNAAGAVRGFWRGLNRAMDLGSRAQITELFLVYLPYWRAQALLAGWVFGQQRVRSGKSSHLEPREVKLTETKDWTGAAAEVAEFGVDSVPLEGVEFAVYDSDALHVEGMVFEPTGSETAARETAEKDWRQQASQRAGLDSVGQMVLHFLRRSLALFYYPLWVARYTYRQRAYQVVVDGFTGCVLYGKAPGNVIYRALMLVAGTALGSFILVNGLVLAGLLVAGSDSDDSLALLALPLVAGAALIGGGYRLFRWGEEIEHRAKKGKK